jgi:hypothetical protein
LNHPPFSGWGHTEKQKELFGLQVSLFWDIIRKDPWFLRVGRENIVGTMFAKRFRGGKKP